MGLQCFTTALTLFLVVLLVFENVAEVEGIMGLGSSMNMKLMQQQRRSRKKGQIQKNQDTPKSGNRDVADQKLAEVPVRNSRSAIEFAISD